MTGEDPDRTLDATVPALEAASLADRRLDEPHECRLPSDHPHRASIIEAHALALRTGRPGYLDPLSGQFVLTAGYLAQRGFCCELLCRHCPYVR